MITAIDLARYVVARSNKIAHGVNRLQLEQILYFIQAEFLVVFDKPCFADDTFPKLMRVWWNGRHSWLRTNRFGI